MPSKKQKLELTWIGKDNRPKLEPRILLEDPENSYHAPHRVGAHDIFDNKLIFGDNLLALKALEQDYAGKVKCVFIDPPYNTGSAFEHYDDGVEHSLWLSLIRERLFLLRSLMASDGCIWIAIDDNECHYLKVLCDEVFGRFNFIGNIVWQSKDTPGNNASGVAETHNHILGFRKSDSFVPNLLPRSDKQLANYKNLDNDPRGNWLGTPMTRAEHRDRDYYPIKNDAGREVFPPKGSSWRRPPATMKKLQEENRIYWGKTGDSEFPMEKKFLSEVKSGVVNQTWWPYDFAGSTRNASAEMKGLFGGTKAFETPKPEKLAYRIIQLSTTVGDIVLDSFLGSGTTAAVAHKMGRRWIGIELGDHCHTHCIPRLQKVIDGEDPGGITKAVDWKGGGGFRYYKLAPSLLEKDRWDNWVISKDYNPTMLAQAVCKLEGFTYEPSDSHYWMHGYSTEQDFLYVTTASLKHVQLAQLSDEVGPDRSLLVVCTSFRGSKNGYPNLTVKKIPQAVLNRCEWGKDDYSLRVENLPDAPPKEGQQEMDL